MPCPGTSPGSRKTRQSPNVGHGGTFTIRGRPGCLAWRGHGRLRCFPIAPADAGFRVSCQVSPTVSMILGVASGLSRGQPGAWESELVSFMEGVKALSDRAAIWNAVHQERQRLVQDLESIADEQWGAPSLCAGWSVHDVLAHLIDSATTTRLGFLRQMVSARFDFDRANAVGVERHRRSDPRMTLAAFRAARDRSDAPPASLATRLVEAYVHGEDIRRPLGIESYYPTEHVVTALSYMARTGAGLGGGRERVNGLRLSPSDFDLHIGEGLEVRGSAISLLLAVSGRPIQPGEVTGAGAMTLSARA